MGTSDVGSAVRADVGPVSKFLAAGALGGFAPLRVYVVYAGEEASVSGEFFAFNDYEYGVSGTQSSDIGYSSALYGEFAS